MLHNDTPPGTKVRFLRPVHKIKALETATLIGPVHPYVMEQPEDQFEVMHDRERIVVQRRDLEKA